ncbi:MAG: lactate utilization protein [Ardenticatenaceae bacterium]|nr:lactate utilization protein [Ardenticatenaceae bacterium]
MTPDTVLDRIRRQLAGRTPPPAPSVWRGRPPYEDPAAVLVAQLERNGAQALIAPDAAARSAAIAALFDELGVTRAVMNPDPGLADLDLPARFPAVAWTIAGQVPPEALRGACATADVGLSGATAALAETGSVVVESGPSRSRLVTLLPPASIVVVHASAIVPDLFAWAAVRPAPVPANVVIISGPSKSADIEQTLAVGVHGPGHLLVLVRQS